jgi:Fe-S-cluster containining protein
MINKVFLKNTKKCIMVKKGDVVRRNKKTNIKNKNHMFDRTKNKKITLEERLNRVYDSVDLRTTCKRSLTCCMTACPQMNFCEFSSLINEIWRTSSKSQKIEMICKSVEYFFHNEFEKYQMDTLVKPCMLLSTEGKCSYYTQRPLSCRMYGLWPKDMYKERVDKFEKAYDGLLKREELPLNTQCPNVKRIDNSKPLTREIVEGLYKQLDDIDVKIGQYTDSQIENKENYRTFHDWLLLKVFGEQWLVDLTLFMRAGSRLTIDAMVETLKQAIVNKFSNDMPNLGGIV